MKKYEYLSELEKRLSALPEAERRDALNYYEEYFDAAGPDKEAATATEGTDNGGTSGKMTEQYPPQSHTPPQIHCSKSTTFVLAVQERFLRNPLCFVCGCGTILLISK